MGDTPLESLAIPRTRAAVIERTTSAVWTHTHHGVPWCLEHEICDYRTARCLAIMWIAKNGTQAHEHTMGSAC